MRVKGMYMIKRIGILSVLITLFLVVGCARVTQVKLKVYDAQRILLLPTQSKHKELKDSTTSIDKQLFTRFNQSKFTVITPSTDDFSQAHKTALESSGAIYDPAVGNYVPLNSRDYILSLSGLLSLRYQFDSIAVPKLVLRQASIETKYVLIDGSKRKFEYMPGTPNSILPRQVKGLSLQLKVYTRNNNNTKAVFSGISLPFLIREQNNQPEFVLKTVFFTEKELKQGVDAAIKALKKQLRYKK